MERVVHMKLTILIMTNVKESQALLLFLNELFSNCIYGSKLRSTITLSSKIAINNSPHILQWALYNFYRQFGIAE
jgi:hypothetical protein